MPRGNVLTGHDQRAEDAHQARRLLSDACDLLSNISASLENDGQKVAAEIWESEASDVREIIARIHKFAR